MLDQSFQHTGANEFSVTPGSFGALRKQMLKRLLIPVLIIVPLMVWLASGGEPAMWITALIVSTIIGFTIHNTIKRQEKLFYSYRLIITPERVQRDQEGMAPIIIPTHEITQIIKSNSGAFRIIGRSKLNAIIVYAQVERPEALEQQLNELTPVQIRPESGRHQLLWLLLLLIPVALYGIFVLDNIWLSGLALLVFTAGMLWSLFVMYTSRNVEKRLRYIAWVGLLPVLSVISAWLSRWELW